MNEQRHCSTEIPQSYVKRLKDKTSALQVFKHTVYEMLPLLFSPNISVLYLSLHFDNPTTAVGTPINMEGERLSAVSRLICHSSKKKHTDGSTDRAWFEIFVVIILQILVFVQIKC